VRASREGALGIAPTGIGCNLRRCGLKLSEAVAKLVHKSGFMRLVKRHQRAFQLFFKKSLNFHKLGLSYFHKIL
jgi:hypothetical protein